MARLRLTPQKREFFQLYTRAARNAVAISQLLVELLDTFPADGDTKIRDIKDLEHEGDRLTHELVDLLNRTFVTPFDRDDMYRLAGALDDVCDHVDEAAGNILGYGVTEIREKARKQAALIERAATKLREAVAKVEGFKDSQRELVELRELEDEGDRLNRGKGIIDTGLATEKTVLAALIGAIAWNLLTWWLGLPSSSSHALIGGLVGAALVQSGSKGVEWHGIAHKVAIPALIAPTAAFFVAFGLLLFIYWAFQWLAHGVATRGFRLGQLVSGTFVAFSHGANDAQKTMGVIALALYTHGTISHFYVPTWVKIAAGVAIGAGTD